MRTLVPPGGHILGVYARTDAEPGVWKAPANEVLSGALDVEFTIDDSTQDDLAPRGVNAIRQFPGRGIRVWGARTIGSDAFWKYVNVRRLFIFIERSLTSIVFCMNPFLSAAIWSPRPAPEAGAYYGAVLAS